MTKPKPSQDVISRPAPRVISPVSTGISRLIGETPAEPAANEPAEPAAAPASPKPRSSKKAPPAEDQKRVTFAMRCGKGYLDQLESLYLHERASRRNLAKADLIEEAFKDLFAKYARKAR